MASKSVQKLKKILEEREKEKERERERKEKEDVQFSQSSKRIGAVMANIKIEVSEPTIITAVITKESAERLGLKDGDDVTALIKSTEVIIGK